MSSGTVHHASNGGYGNYRGSESAPAVSHVFDGVSGLLAGLGLGLATAPERDDLAAHVRRLTHERGLTARVHSFRYGALTLAAPPQDAALLRMDLDVLRDSLNDVLDEPIERIQLRIDRSPATA